jgi:hypothetical protein
MLGICCLYQMKMEEYAISTRWIWRNMLSTRWIWRNMLSLPDEYGAICYLYQMNMEEYAISTSMGIKRWCWASICKKKKKKNLLQNAYGHCIVKLIPQFWYMTVGLAEMNPWASRKEKPTWVMLAFLVKPIVVKSLMKVSAVYGSLKFITRSQQFMDP